ncbi:tyrosine-type recombinase/integrase [Paracoccus sp. YLB-12]|uniref:Tyrosine-type recombinase/integrase n=1 Tax=Paracoccus maritimus TaxID=2933292 RepID=A0ABT2KB79_9RHOB|nr:site-specific integrase [Paracoccus sp. YLB-12]MCT4333774.1 tyrosine-type recombinase/integrase [Paracoccus sp. YLB-12]
MTKRNAFPGATIVEDARGGKRIRLRKTIKGRKIDTYLPGPWGSQAMVEAYKAAITGQPDLPKATGPRGTFDYTITHYLSSRRFLDLAEQTRYAKRLRLDWIRQKIGAGRLVDLEPRHVEHLMDLKGGKEAANRLHKELGQLYGHAKRYLDFNATPPTERVERRKIRSNGFHTWSDQEVQKYREFHPSGTLPRLALELIIGTGAARQDACRMGRQNIKGTDIWYMRGKTGQDVTLPLSKLPELQTELRQVPTSQALFFTHSGGKPYTVESFGNWFADQAKEAGLPHCRAHGLRKFGATRLAERGATEFQIMAFLAHKDPREARRYVQAASRVKLASDALSHLENVQHPESLDKTNPQVVEMKGKK